MMKFILFPYLNKSVRRLTWTAAFNFSKSSPSLTVPDTTFNGRPFVPIKYVVGTALTGSFLNLIVHKLNIFQIQTTLRFWITNLFELFARFGAIFHSNRYAILFAYERDFFRVPNLIHFVRIRIFKAKKLRRYLDERGQEKRNYSEPTVNVNQKNQQLFLGFNNCSTNISTVPIHLDFLLFALDSSLCLIEV